MILQAIYVVSSLAKITRNSIKKGVIKNEIFNANTHRTLFGNAMRFFGFRKRIEHDCFWLNISPNFIATGLFNSSGSHGFQNLLSATVLYVLSKTENSCRVMANRVCRLVCVDAKIEEPNEQPLKRQWRMSSGGFLTYNYQIQMIYFGDKYSVSVDVVL